MKYSILPVIALLTFSPAFAGTFEDCVQMSGAHFDDEAAHLVTCFQYSYPEHGTHCESGIFTINAEHKPDWGKAQKICAMHHEPLQIRLVSEGDIVKGIVRYDPAYQNTCALVDRHFSEENRHENEEKSIDMAVSSLSDFSDLGAAMGILK